MLMLDWVIYAFMNNIIFFNISMFEDVVNVYTECNNAVPL